MNSLDRKVRAAVYQLFVAGIRDVGPRELSERAGVSPTEASDSLRRLAAEHRLAVHGERVVMAHPFSGADTGHYSIIEDRVYWANCAWDALAILALLGDGEAVCPTGPRWRVANGQVSPGGVVHLVVPARSFWDDVAFTWANILGFRSEAEVDIWVEQTGLPRGAVVPAQTMYGLSTDWYRGRMDEDWQPRTARETVAVFESHGLVGEFWELG